MNLARDVFRWLFGRRLPTTNGEITINGIRSAITIRRDRYGIAYVGAENDADAWFGLGFCHGQDRAFQLERYLRIVRGTLSEVVGPSGLPVDRVSRRIGLARAAQGQIRAMDRESQTLLQAYAGGINAGSTRGCRRPAHEFSLLRIHPTQFKPADCLAIANLLSLFNATNWDCELARLKVLTEHGPEAVLALDHISAEGIQSEQVSITGMSRAVENLDKDLAQFTALVGRGGGSNNWVLAPSRTSSGRPLLANDPHLPAFLPSYWYLAHVRTPEWAVAGASFAGAPAFLIGHNGTAAWGVTTGMVDNTDLYLEQIGPDGRSVRRGDEFVPCPVRQEIIRVKGGEPVVEEVLETPRGPIVGPALLGEVGAISFQATWLQPRPISGLFRIHRARSFDEFRRAFEQWPVSSYNLVYADIHGDIGWQLIGDTPKRKKGRGTIPLPGWDPEAGWEEEPVPFKEMPHADNPAGGILATANNKPETGPDAPYLGIDFDEGYRVERIMEVLQTRRDWDVAGMQALQMDLSCLPWRELRSVVLALPQTGPVLDRALSLLKAWDGFLHPSSPAAALFEFFLSEMARRIALVKAPNAVRWVLGEGFSELAPLTTLIVRRTRHLVNLARTQPSGWFERSWPEEMADALSSAMAHLEETYGKEIDKWAWGRVRPLVLDPLGRMPGPLARVFRIGPVPLGGDCNTLAAAVGDPQNPTASPITIPTLRMVLDVGNWDQSKFSLPCGQSGNPCSPHYDDLLPLWLKGDGVAIAWSDEAVKESAQECLKLTPV